MKTFKLLLGILSICFSTITMAQEKKTDSTTVKNNNLLDMQTKTLSKLFGSNLDGNTDGKTIGYLELIEKSSLSEAQKTEYRNLYHLQAKELTEKQKDSLGKVISKKINEAERIDD